MWCAEWGASEKGVVTLCQRTPSSRMRLRSAIPVTGEIEFQYVKSVIGSGYEASVAALALEDGIAHRAARKNMQMHSAIILLIGGEFAGFYDLPGEYRRR